MTEDIQKLEIQLYELTNRINALRRAAGRGTEVGDYTFATQDGNASLADLFAGQDKLLLIHNMGQACRFCTLWADGINGFLPHLESVMSVVLVSKDTPAQQRNFANSRGWRFRLASHGGGDYIRDQTVMADGGNMPGAVCYEQHEGKIYRRQAAIFGPGDLYCSAWNLLGLAGMTEADWTPQYRYWQRPSTMEDGGANLIDETAGGTPE